MDKTKVNFCSAIVEYKDAEGNTKRQSLCSIREAMVYVENVVLANNWTFVSIERGFNY